MDRVGDSADPAPRARNGGRNGAPGARDVRVAAGDGKWYIVGAPDMESYLTLLWGKPDVHIKTTDDAKKLEGTLAPGQIAIFAGPHHSGAIMGQDPGAGFAYHDAYVESDSGVMPVSAWTLPP